ncbi:hypothetical protein SAMN04488505_110200 [Chitinophaga rupis]|uniref:DUF6268 domain-containing protein n=1 Tax=Chitinophaga rupis TaxID=573321 RepID=A0A1H8GNC9_9BACT|nr:DUF6268 family outer membrane beta-barrel protein [Chitinophaga rupis]SEN45631.1 hypothetical protein SAMN04488505_110200 [Chitinophaga rupis]
MNIRKRVVVTKGMLLLSAACFSQTRDSIPAKTRDSVNISKRVETYAADKFAISRPLNIEFIHTSPYNYTSKRGEEQLPESRVTGFEQIKVSANINFIKKQTWMLGATLGYRYTALKADITKPAVGGIMPVDDEFHYLFSSLNFTYFSKLFNKRTIYTSSILFDGSDKHFERVKGLFTGTMILKANQRTKLMVGLLVNIDPSSQTPVLPTFSYEHKFNNGLIVDMILPRSLYLRKYVFTNGRISLGTEIDRTSFYLYNIDGTDQRYEYRQLDLNSGLMYEHVIAKHFVLTARTGMKITPSGRVFRKEDSFGDPVFQTTPDPAFYFNVGISFNPFTVLGIKK